jgi:hypothetical protein
MRPLLRPFLTRLHRKPDSRGEPAGDTDRIVTPVSDTPGGPRPAERP